MEKTGTSAVITGSSSGLGAQFARQFAARGYDLILIARRKDRLESLAASLHSEFNVIVTVCPADLSLSTDLDLILSLLKSTPNIDVLVNNAGFGIFHSFVKTDPQKALTLLNLHMVAPVMLCQSVLPGMVTRKKGTIINVSSIAGIFPVHSVLYGSSKKFLITFSESLAEEYRNSGITVQALCPGFVKTEFHDTPEYARFSRKNIPGFLWMVPEQVTRESLLCLERDKVICIPGRFYRFIAVLARNSATAGLIVKAARYVFRRHKLDNDQ